VTAPTLYMLSLCSKHQSWKSAVPFGLRSWARETSPERRETLGADLYESAGCYRMTPMPNTRDTSFNLQVSHSQRR